MKKNKIIIFIIAYMLSFSASAQNQTVIENTMSSAKQIVIPASVIEKETKKRYPSPTITVVPDSLVYNNSQNVKMELKEIDMTKVNNISFKITPVGDITKEQADAADKKAKSIIVTPLNIDGRNTNKTNKAN